MWAVKVVIREQLLLKCFSWMVLKPLLIQSGLFFKNTLHAFFTKTIFKKKQTNKLGCIFVSNMNFERIRNTWEITASIRAEGCNGIASVDVLVYFGLQLLTNLLWEGFEFPC